MTRIIDCIVESEDPAAVRAALDELAGAVRSVEGVDARREEVAPSHGIAETVFAGSVLLTIAGDLAMGLAVNAIWHWIATRRGKKPESIGPEITQPFTVKLDGVTVMILPRDDSAQGPADQLPPG